MIESCFCRNCRKTEQVLREIINSGLEQEEIYRCTKCGNMVRITRTKIVQPLIKPFIKTNKTKDQIREKYFPG